MYFYNARWYDPALGRFAQADTIIPQSQGVQAFDRYAYTNNNPVRYIDPSGHFTEDEIAEMWGYKDKNDKKFRELWERWTKNGFRDILLNAKLGDIISFQFENDVVVQLMFGEMEDGTLGFWNIDTEEYVSKEYADTYYENSTSWALFTRDTSQDGTRDDGFDDYTPTPWKKGDPLDLPDLDYYWAGGVDDKPGYVEIRTNLDGWRFGMDLVAIFAPLVTLRYAGPGFLKDAGGWATGGGAIPFNLGFKDIWDGGYINDRVPRIHP